MTTYISVAKTLSSRERGVGIKGDSKGQVFRKLVQMDLDPDEYNIIEFMNGSDISNQNQKFLIRFKDRYINECRLYYFNKARRYSSRNNT